MENFKFLLISVLFFSSVINPSYGSTHNTTQELIPLKCPITKKPCELDGIIVMEGDILRADTGNNDIIAVIEIFDANQKSIIKYVGCSQSVCEINISNLSVGQYTVCVTTFGGNDFSELITIN